MNNAEIKDGAYGYILRDDGGGLAEFLQSQGRPQSVLPDLLRYATNLYAKDCVLALLEAGANPHRSPNGVGLPPVLFAITRTTPAGGSSFSDRQRARVIVGHLLRAGVDPNETIEYTQAGQPRRYKATAYEYADALMGSTSETSQSMRRQALYAGYSVPLPQDWVLRVHPHLIESTLSEVPRHAQSEKSLGGHAGP